MEGINKCEEAIKQLEINSTTTTQTQIHEFFNKIRIKLDEREQELLNKLEEIEKYKKKELEIQKEDLKFGIESIIGSCQMIQNSIILSNNNKNDLQLISMKNLYESRLNYLSNNIWKSEPCRNSFIEFLICEKDEQSIYSNFSNIGSIDSNDISPDKCLISRNKAKKIHENEEFNFEIISYSKEGNEIKKGGNGKRFVIYIEGEPKSDDENKEENNEWNIVDLNNGRYEVKMKLKKKGKYSIFVQYDEIEINSFQIQVFSKLKQRNYNEINELKVKFELKMTRNYHLSSSHGITVNSKGNIFICEESNVVIQMYDSKGNFISKLGLEGIRNGNFNYPWGITINSKDNIIIGDRNDNVIQIFDSKGYFISAFGSQGNKNGQFRGPHGICVDLNDNIYVCDFYNHRIQKFNSEGKFLSKFGSEGNGNGQFNGPIGIAINSKGKIIVCEHLGNRIQIFDSEGNFISEFGSQGNRNGQLYNPFGICIDLNDNILVCDFSNFRIQIFDSNGKYITQFKSNSPTAITIDPNTQNIIVSHNDHQVSIF